MTLNKPLLSAALLAVLIPAGAFALSVGDTVGTDVDEIRAQFEAQGYTVTEIETEDGEIEVEYLDGDKEYEVSIAMDTGVITEVELEDDDD
jgi:hypothetical protein